MDALGQLVILLMIVIRVYANRSMFARRGENVTLTCPSPTRSWLMWQNNTIVNDGLLINPNLPNSGRLTIINNTTTNSLDLHIRSVAVIDEATYSCTFLSNNSDWKIQFSLYVEPDNPAILNIQGGSYIEGTEEQQLSMTCQSYNGNPPADVTWKTGQTDLVTSKNTVTYQFTPIRTNYLQTYTCVSNSPALSNPLQISVQLLLNLQPQTTVVTVTAVKEGDNIEAQCMSTGSRPAAQMSWLLDGVIQTPTGQKQDIQDTATQTYNVSLQYQKTSSRSDNTKTLVCRANNTALPGGISGQQQLIVWFGPDSATISGNTTLNENTGLSLTCNAALSNPQSTLTWYKNGSPLTVSSPVSTQNGDYGGRTTHQTYITTVRRGDNGDNITCVATSTVRSATAYLILNIRYRPTVQIHPSSTTAIVGSTNVLLSCVVTHSNPPPNSYRWTKGGNQISVNQNYAVQNVRRSDAGTYNCTSSNIAGTSNQATATLNVLYPPEIADIANQTPEEGTTLTVNCAITESNPAPNPIYWTRSKDPTFRQNSSVLTIQNISRNHTDTYTCHAENIMSPSSGSSVVGSDQKQVTVDVLYGPGNSVQLYPMSSTISMEENTGSIPTVRCQAECNPPCQYSWTGNTGSSNATLNLGTATRDKNGTYTCKASNSIGGNKRENQKELNVLIFYHARITSLKIQSGAIHDEHSDVSLICTVNSYPVSNVTWTSTGDRPPDTQEANPSSTLLLRNVSCHDTANYTCSAYNGYGSHSMETKTLYVRCTPRLPSTEKEREEVGVGDGENLTISSTYMAYPAPNVSWHFKATSTNISKLIGQPLVEQIGLNMFNSTLVRVLKDEDDFGEYRSVAINSAGSDTAHQIYIVAANRQPSIATNISAQCQTSTTANISWTRGFDGGPRQWFNIMYRPTTTDTYTSSSNVSDNKKEYRQYHIIFQLSPATQYSFKVKSTNSHGSVLSLEEFICKTDESEEEGSSSSAVIGGVAGTSAAILLVVIVIVGIFLFRRVQSKKQADGKDLSERPLATMKEVPDGIKDNILYESAGDNFNQPRQDVYAEVVKPKKKGAAVKTNDLYAEVQKPNKSNKKKLKGQENKVMMDVYENVGDINGASKQQGEKSNNQKPAERGYRNEDGLLYVDVDIKPSTDGRRNVIIGEEERTDYASVDFVVPP